MRPSCATSGSPDEHTAQAPSANVELVEIKRYRRLQQLAWHCHTEALALYEGNWRHVDQASVQPHERELLAALTEPMATERFLFERKHHQRIAGLLGALDAELPARHPCRFGGGTAIALRAAGTGSRATSTSSCHRWTPTENCGCSDVQRGRIEPDEPVLNSHLFSGSQIHEDALTSSASREPEHETASSRCSSTGRC